MSVKGGEGGYFYNSVVKMLVLLQFLKKKMSDIALIPRVCFHVLEKLAELCVAGKLVAHLGSYFI